MYAYKQVKIKQSEKNPPLSGTMFNFNSLLRFFWSNHRIHCLSLINKHDKKEGNLKYIFPYLDNIITGVEFERERDKNEDKFLKAVKKKITISAKTIQKGTTLLVLFSVLFEKRHH